MPEITTVITVKRYLGNLNTLKPSGSASLLSNVSRRRSTGTRSPEASSGVVACTNQVEEDPARHRHAVAMPDENHLARKSRCL
jgi:hypothetical protein